MLLAFYHLRFQSSYKLHHVLSFFFFESQVGAYLQFNVEAKTQGGSKASNSSSSSFSFGDGNIITFATQALLNGQKWVTLIPPPTVSTNNKKNLFSMTFPAFTTSVQYDPTLTVAGVLPQGWPSWGICTLSVVLCALVGVLPGTFARDEVNLWFPLLHQPSFTPPNWLFGPAWSIWFCLMGLALGLVHSTVVPEWVTVSKTAATLSFLVMVRACGMYVYEDQQ
jgi:hypothetical protein